MIYIHIYRVSENFSQSRSVKVDWPKLRRKVFYCFAIFAIINEKLIKEDRPKGRSLRRAPSHSSLLSSPITASPRAAIMLQ